ncbi:MAG: Threonine synthase [bacterium ADurb.Bin400]|nr:MAG: Threonine synthase [bacterium ADurb.Bin400]
MFGAKVILVPGSFDDCIPILNGLVSDYGVYPGNSLNPARIEGHQATVFLAAKFFGWEFPEWFIVPVGNGSNCSSIGKALRLMKSQGFNASSRILGCQSKAANPIWQSWIKSGGQTCTRNSWQLAYTPVTVGETIATAARIGNPVSKDKVIREITYSNGAMAEASEFELAEAVLVCSKDGHFVCPQTGIALAGLRQAVASGLFRKGQKVVVVSTADGLKFTQPFVAKNDNPTITAPDCRIGTIADIIGI